MLLWRVFRMNSATSAIMNNSADFWHYYVGVNTYPANTKKKEIFEKWSQGQDNPISDEVHETWKKNGYYNDESSNYNSGIAIIPGKIWRGPYKGKILVAIDLDNKKAIEEFCGNGLEE